MSYYIKEEQDGTFGVYDDDEDCVERGFHSRESAQESIDEMEEGDAEAELVSDALDLAIDHILAKRKQQRTVENIEEAKRLMAEMLRG